MTENPIFMNSDPYINYEFISNMNSSCNSVTLSDYINASYSCNSLSIINYNIRSFSCNFEKFSSGFQANELPHIFCFTETWFDSISKTDIPNYNGFHVIRNERSGGGISFYVSDKFSSRLISDLSYVCSTIEVCTIEVCSNNFNIICISIYRPHSDIHHPISFLIFRIFLKILFLEVKPAYY